jgi:hypothetical protein
LEDVNKTTDKSTIEEVASINLKSYLKRKNRLFHLCAARPLFNLDIQHLGELVKQYKFENNTNTSRTMKLIIATFPEKLIKIAQKFNENQHEISNKLRRIQITPNLWKTPETITVKEFQQHLKIALQKVE